VYSKNRCFRAIHSTKPKKQNRLKPVDYQCEPITEYEIEEYLVEDRTPHGFSKLSREPVAKEKQKHKRRKKAKFQAINIPENIIERLKSKPLKCFDWKGGKFNGRFLNMDRIASGHCELCDRTHDRVGGFLVIGACEIRQGCWNYPTRETYVL